MPPSRPADAAEVTAELLRHRPLPRHADGDGKGGRGQVLVIGGSRVTGGAVLLAATAALRAGAGKLQVATVKTVAPALMTALPEALVVGLPETDDGAIHPAHGGEIERHIIEADAVLVGTGALDADGTADLLRHVLKLVTDDALVVVDAIANQAIPHNEEAVRRLEGRVVAIPNDGEWADLGFGDPATCIADEARRLGATLACRGDDTWLADPADGPFRHPGGGVGLAMSGSGDVVAGVVTGLAARGADPLTAALWGVHVHAMAGLRLADRVGRVGFLARELLDEIPAQLQPS
jgi:hydroxyethylthiazole kinase-like uncharacterized protein yjeF